MKNENLDELGESWASLENLIGVSEEITN